MSLLLEALKKAEKAKEDAKRRAEAGAPPADLAPATEAERHIVTRDELPDISQPLEIAADELSSQQAAARRAAERAPLAIELAPEPAPRSAAAEPPAPRASPDAGRAAAKNVFEAKFKEPNPKLPFYITMGVLAAFAVGTVVYFWIQLRPPPPLVNTNPSRPAEKPVDPALIARPAAPVTTAPAAATLQIPGIPGGSAQPPALSAPPSQAAESAKAPPGAAPPARIVAAAPRDARAPAPAPQAVVAPAPRTRERAPVTTARAAPSVHPRLDQGYAAFQAGDLAAARTAYLDTLRDEPANRDALLGLAAIDMRDGRFESADAHYRRLLRADPRDADAHAGLLALRGDQVDPVQAESRLKTLLAADPDAHVLNFTLGNQYAQQGRWAEAQQSYFRALASDAANPDYAYNLAVSLDQLRQPKLALDYYRRAIVLAQTRAASFDQTRARDRVQALAQAAR